jgi:purine-binding chemotaxis protein CheW
MSHLVCRIVTRLCALPLVHVLETMRPLPVEPLATVPMPVRGVAIIRGIPVPVIDLAWMFAGEESTVTRFVVVRVGHRQIALAVDAVVGVRLISTASMHELPPLLHGASRDVIAAMGALDAELLVVLDSTRVLSEAVWRALDEGLAS